MKIAIMQPYFLPYIGYFQLISAVDKFVVYDNIEYTKKGWINRNRILVNNKDAFISLPLKKDSDYLTVVERSLADTWPQDRAKLLNKITECYRKAPYFKEVYPLVQDILCTDESNLFRFIFRSLQLIKNWLAIPTEMIISSEIDFDQHLKGEEKVIAICKALKADEYINPIGGLTLYDKDRFRKAGLKLSFLRSSDSIVYKQFSDEFIPWLSIIDMMMFNSTEEITLISKQYSFE